MNRIEEILRTGKDRGASDIHLCQDSPVMYRIDGAMIPMSDEIFSAADMEQLVTEMLTDKQKEELDTQGEVDFAYSIENFNRVRANVFLQKGTYAMALRLLASEIPNPKDLGIPQAIVDLTNKKRGMVLVTGATGSGKSTTLAALIGTIVGRDKKTVITLEDPIEYVHSQGESMVLQREIGSDSMSYANAVKAALRQDPDVILVGEMRDLETISIAITAAETGHLVFSTLHTNSAAAAVDRMIDVFPPFQQQQIRVQLAGVLEGVIAQQLLPKEGGGRTAAYEVMLATPAIRNLIREEKSFQIPSMIQTGKKAGMQLMDDAIYDLYMKSYISAETAVNFAHNPIAMTEKTSLF